MSARNGALLDLVAVGSARGDGLAASAVAAAAEAGGRAAFLEADTAEGSLLLVRAARMLLLESSLWQSAEGQVAALKVAAVARAAGRWTALALVDAALVHRHRHALQAFVRRDGDLLLCGSLEACALYDAHRIDTVVPLIRRDCRRAALHRGARGTIAIGPDSVHVLDGGPGGAVDGDYVGALLLALGRGIGLVESCGLAGGAGAHRVAADWPAAVPLAIRRGAAAPG